MGEILDLQGHQTVKRGLPTLGILGKDHLAHQGQPVFLEEHMLGSAKADAFGFEGQGHLRFGIGVGVGTDADIAGGIGPGQEGAEGIIERRFQKRHVTGQNFAPGAIDGDHVTRMDDPAVFGSQRLVAAVERDLRGADDPRQSKTARHHGRMAGHAAPFGQNALSRVHAANILRRRFAPDQDHRLAACGGGLGLCRSEHQLAGQRRQGLPRRRSPNMSRVAVRGVNLAVHQVGTEIPAQSCRTASSLRNHPVLGQGHGDAHRRLGAGAARAPRPEHLGCPPSRANSICISSRQEFSAGRRRTSTRFVKAFREKFLKRYVHVDRV